MAGTTIRVIRSARVSILHPDKYPDESIDDIIASAYKSWKGEGKK
jgi:hypothetical protein